nr:DUF2231 domain-containing protein [Sulfobacillus harzensis]
MLGLWIRIGLHLFPPVIHPMLVHFPIVLLYGSLLTTLLSFVWRDRERFFDRASFWLLVLGLIAGVVAAAAGVISEQYVHWTPTTNQLLSRHQGYAVLTGVFTIVALAVRLWARYPRVSRDGGWSFAGTGHGRPTLLSLVFLVAAVGMITLTASLGGTMVYQYGVGVHGLLYHTPSPLSAHP